jgi:hypothetical protein
MMGRTNYVGNGYIFHYAGFAYGLRRGTVEQISLECFSRGRIIRIRRGQRRFDSCEVVERARSRPCENQVSGYYGVSHLPPNS